MSFLYKVISTKLPPYLYELAHSLQRPHRYHGCFKALRYKTEFFRIVF